MLTVIEQTREEKVAVYLKLTKRELAEMLVNANDAMAVLSALPPEPSSSDPTWGATTWPVDTTTTTSYAPLRMKPGGFHTFSGVD